MVESGPIKPVKGPLPLHSTLLGWTVEHWVQSCNCSRRLSWRARNDLLRWSFWWGFIRTKGGWAVIRRSLAAGHAAHSPWPACKEADSRRALPSSTVVNPLSSPPSLILTLSSSNSISDLFFVEHHLELNINQCGRVLVTLLEVNFA